MKKHDIAPLDCVPDVIALFENRKVMADQLGVTPKSITQVVMQGMFPASWWLILRNEARRQGKQINEDLFRFRLPPPPGVERGDIVADALADGHGNNREKHFPNSKASHRKAPA